MLHGQAPDDPEVAGLLALMLLTEARRPARAAADGALVPLAQQERSLWDRALISEGLQLLNTSLAAGRIGEYQLVASIAALHDEAASHASTRWAEIVKAYLKLESLTDNPIVRLNRAVAVAMVEGPAAVLALMDGLELRDSHRLHAVRAHLYEESGDLTSAARCYAAAASRTDNARERDYLVEQAARANASRGVAGPGTLLTRRPGDRRGAGLGLERAGVLESPRSSLPRRGPALRRRRPARESW
jgi:predicted RNA polymerase sigma factor